MLFDIKQIKFNCIKNIITYTIHKSHFLNKVGEILNFNYNLLPTVSFSNQEKKIFLETNVRE